MYKKLIGILALCFYFAAFGSLHAQEGITFDKYHTNAEVQQILKKIQQNHPEQILLHNIATSPGGESISVLEIGKNLKAVPAIFVGANFEGDIPLSTEGALKLVTMLLDSAEYTSALKWYIMPLPNPDAAKGFFSKEKYDRTVNDFEVNDDVDEAVNEDGFEDLNGDGLITQMRVKDLTGKYKIAAKDPRIMVLADSKKSETGEYKLYTEGIDNDGDGEYNEDAEGGIDIGISFPHLFPKNKKEAGLWPGQSPEVYGIMKFIYDRPEIAMVYTLGSSNFCQIPPKGGRKGDTNPESIKVPSRYASRIGADPEKSYTMNEVIEMMKSRFSGMEITASTVASMLDLGAVVNPMDDDLKFYTKLSDDYKKYLKSKNFNTETLEPAADKDGSFENWAYYQLGVPSFSMNLFSVPKIKEEKNDDKTDELKEQDKSLLAYSDKTLDGKGFVPWQKYKHPTLGEVEIGGYAPYLETTPKSEKIDSLLMVQIPWLLNLSNNLPDISIADEKWTDLGAGIYRLELYIKNTGFLAYPIAIGERNSQPAPVVILLDGDVEMLEGIKRTPLGAIGGNQVKKLAWLIKSDKKGEMTVKLESTVFGSEVKQIKIGG